MTPHPTHPDPTAAAVPVPGPAGRVVELDVRDDLRQRREPFSKIMAAVDALGADDVLHLRATFEPVPLFRALGRQGFAHVARENGPGDWSVWFHRPAGTDAEVAPAAAHIAPPGAAASVASSPTPAVTDVVLDVRGLEPPEPMVRTLAALETLPDGAVLVQRNDRVPQFLLPILGERGFVYEVDESASDAVVVRIHRMR